MESASIVVLNQSHNSNRIYVHTDFLQFNCLHFERIINEIIPILNKKYYSFDLINLNAVTNSNILCMYVYSACGLNWHISSQVIVNIYTGANTMIML